MDIGSVIDTAVAHGGGEKEVGSRMDDGALYMISEILCDCQ